MKRAPLFIIATALLLSSCSKMEQLFSRAYGSEIVFGSSSKRGSDTKAEYSGKDESGNNISNGKFERINWEKGDAIRIYCEQASVYQSADYKVISDASNQIVSNGTSSSAKIKPKIDSLCLRWGTEGVTHNFSALYPAPANETTAVFKDSVTCYLPSIQNYKTIWKTDKGNVLTKFNPSFLFLAGNATAVSGTEDTQVDIYFDPAFTAFDFRLQNDYGKGKTMSFTKAGIKTESGKLSGEYKVCVSNINESTALCVNDIKISNLESEEIYMNFSDTVSLDYGKYVRFTLFAQPGNDITKLTFWFLDTEGVKHNFAFKYAEDSTQYNDSDLSTEGWVNFKALHKSIITGILAPESARWTINTVPVVAEWGVDNKDIEIEPGNVLTFDTKVELWTEKDCGNIEFGDK